MSLSNSTLYVVCFRWTIFLHMEHYRAVFHYGQQALKSESAGAPRWKKEENGASQ